MKVSFKPSEEFAGLANKVYQEQKERIIKLIPSADVQHIGSTAITGSMTKGDVDINVRVELADFDKAKKFLEENYNITQPENWTPDFASFKDETSYELLVGIQLTVIGSKYDDFVKLRDLLRSKSELLKEFNELKLKYEDKNMDKYREAKAKFFEKLRTYLKWYESLEQN